MPRSTSSDGQQQIRPSRKEAMKHTCQEQRQKCDDKHQEDRDDAASNPVKDWDKIIASRLSTYNIARRINLADRELFVKGPKENHYK